MQFLFAKKKGELNAAEKRVLFFSEKRKEQREVFCCKKIVIIKKTFTPFVRVQTKRDLLRSTKISTTFN